MNVISLLIILITVHTVLILIAIFVVNYIIECKIKNLENNEKAKSVLEQAKRASSL